MDRASKIAACPPSDLHGRRDGAAPCAGLHLVIVLLCSAILLLSAVLGIREQQHVVVPVLNWTLPETCTLRRATGWPCPGCGMTRAFISIADGDLRAAWNYNRAALPLFAWVMLVLVYELVQLARIWLRKTPLNLGHWGLVPLCLVALLTFGHGIWRLWKG